jgi:Protein of unknown function (DUF2817)
MPHQPISEAIASFSKSYEEARTKFRAAADAAGLAIESHIHPLKGRDGEELALDVVREGDANAECVLIVSSACHGVEGYCGTGVQVAALNDATWRKAARDAGVAVVYMHALNPYGFSHWRRVTHENVDLNRNFQDFTKPLPVNAAYRELHSILLPDQWPPSEENVKATEAFIATRGMPAYQAAISGGQHEFPAGLFFGGHGPTWSNQAVRKVLRTHCASAKRVAWIDLHTGLGPNGHGERIYAGLNDAATIARARRWWDGGGATPITSTYDGSSTSAPLTGLMWFAVHDECPQAEYTGIAMEYGTQPLANVLQALRAEQWLQLHPEAPQTQRDAIKQQLLEAFYTDTDEWKHAILRQAHDAMLQAVRGLSKP